MDEKRCSFCGKGGDADVLIQAPGGAAYICDECIRFCAEFLNSAEGMTVQTFARPAGKNPAASPPGEKDT